MKERKTWRAKGAFENVAVAEKALEARRKGESLDKVFEEQREELGKARRPRQPAMVDVLEKGQEGKDLKARKQSAKERVRGTDRCDENGGPDADINGAVGEKVPNVMAT
jgi:hypothetical protein